MDQRNCPTDRQETVNLREDTNESFTATTTLQDIRLPAFITTAARYEKLHGVD